MRPRRTLAPLPILALALAALGTAGARAADFGEVSFPNSGAPQAQAPFLRGLAQLHDFEYSSAADSFRAAEAADPGFAMAYWGEAMTYNHPIWHEQDRDGGRAALARLGATAEERLAKAPTEREKAWLGAVEVLYGDGDKHQRDRDYLAAMARLHARYPDDPDAAAFHALAVLGSAHEGRDFPTYMKAAAILEEVYCQHPRHPGVLHYMIHSYDDPVHAPLGLRAARTYAEVAPEAAHAQHMTSHIFVALGMWPEVVAANERASAVANRMRAARDQPPTHCGHYNFWLLYGYTETGRKADAAALLAACRADAMGSGGGSALDPDRGSLHSFLSMRARYLLDTGDWQGEAAGWQVPLAPEQAPERVTWWFTQGFAAARRGDAAGLGAALAKLGAARADLTAYLAGHPDDYAASFAARATILEQELEALQARARGDLEGGISILRDAAAEEEKIPLMFGPPFIDKPTLELLGELLLEAKRPAEARDAFERALVRTPGRVAATRGLAEAEAALAAGGG
jgi:hypothetical protein